ncbi:ABC transporter substrate-binding protein [Brachybacterium paraconglomeratum]|uniref:ABC transporter substrate-binding protein n=1 Tax=Brachybacterium paraconglomeratum TaxID=173362 RepID=UPI003FD5082D
MTIPRRTVMTGSLLGAAALAASGCSFDRGSSGGGAGEDGGPTEVRIAGWGGTQWTQNFNIFSPTAPAVTPGSAFFYEPLVRLDRTQAGTVLPHLAESWEFNEDGTELTFTLRDDVTWNDGEPFTAADVAFTWQLVLDGETNAVYPFSAVEALDDTHVVVTYEQPAYSDLIPFNTRRIVPEHIWGSEDPAAFTNPEPVGTGPFVLDSFSPQQVTLSVRDDYWGEASEHVQTVKILAMSADAAKDALIKGDIDYGTMGWENGEEEFVALDPENNEYSFYPTGTSVGIVFNVTVPPFDDPAVRRALRAAVDLQAAADAVKVGYSVPTAAGLDANVYEQMLASDQEQALDVDAATKELEDAGWTVEDGKLVKNGESHALRYDVYQPYTEWVLTGQLLADQWKSNLGLEVEVNQLADQPYADVIEAGEYGMISSSPIGGSSIAEVVAGLDPDLVGEAGDNQGNEMLYKNTRLGEIGDELNQIEPGEDDERVRELAIEVQEILTEDCPFIATATAGWKAVFNKSNWSNWPVMGETTFVPNNTLPSDAILTLMSIEPTR